MSFEVEESYSEMEMPDAWGGRRQASPEQNPGLAGDTDVVVAGRAANAEGGRRQTSPEQNPGLAGDTDVVVAGRAAGAWGGRRQASPEQNPGEPGTVGYEVARPRPANEIFGFRERPYDQRWGVPKQVQKEFGLGIHVIKAGWMNGWIRARQATWQTDEKRVQTVYCFEDIHTFIERVMRRVSVRYAETWWTDESVQQMAEKIPEGPYLRREKSAKAPAIRKDGFTRLPRKYD